MSLSASMNRRRTAAGAARLPWLLLAMAALNLAQAKQILDSIDKPPAKTKAA